MTEKNPFDKTIITIDFGRGEKREYTVCEAHGGNIRAGMEVTLRFTHPKFGENFHAELDKRGTYFK